MRFFLAKRKTVSVTKTEAQLRAHRCAFTGHRPEKLHGQEGYVVVELRKAIEAAIQDGYTTFITGCSRGVDYGK